MSAFWFAAKEMLRERGRLVIAGAAAIVSGAGLGTGLVALGPVLDVLVGEERGLDDIARDFNGRSPIDLPIDLVAVLPRDPFTSVLVIMSGLLLLTVIGAIANFVHMALSLSVVERTVARIRRRAFSRLVRFPLERIVTGGATDPVSRVINDPQQLGQGMSALLSRGVSQVAKGLGALVGALVIEWRITLLTIAIAPVLYTIVRKIGKTIRRSTRAALQRQSDLYGAAGEAMRGLRTVKTHNAEARESARFAVVNREVLRYLLRARIARAMSSPLVESVAIVVLGVLAVVATKAKLDGEIDGVSMLVALGALGISGASLRPLTGIVNDVQASTAAAERIARLLEEPVEPGLDRTLPRLPRHTKGIRFESVSLTYEGGDRPAIDAVDLEINHGEAVAFVGPNGSGKTTLLGLVPRLYGPGSGRVLIDGQDIAGVGVRSLRRQIGVVTQETVLFAGSIAENVAYGSRGVSRERIEDACKRARAWDFVEAKGGLDAIVGESGLTLSGGQRQRLAIARAILRDPAILILDEATSMIDAESEAQINDALAELRVGRTTLIVAHRLSTVLSADRIVVLDEGQLVDHGTHAELLERCDVYKRLAERQLVSA
ncbi:MAG: ABC transporter ATP-binding protein [Planctomycetota bacterium]